ncbi:hypothetical protein Tco_0047360 [Tanacetum coccineum]
MKGLTFRGDGSSKNYKVLSEMLEDFDRQDVEELYRLVKERYSASRPEGYDLMLWGDLHTLFEPDEDDEIWKNQHEYNVISWSLYDFCGIHILLMQNGIAIHMLTEKKYPLSQEMISKMLKKKLEVDHESSQAFELLSKSVSNNPFPKSSEFNVEHYATLVAYPALFHKYPEPFLCLVGISHHYTLDKNTYPKFLHDNDEEMDLLTFIRTADPTKVRVGEQKYVKGEPRLLDTIVGRVVPLLPVAPARDSSELEASVDKLFDEGGSGDQAEQGESINGGQGVGIQFVSEAVETVVEDVAPLGDHGTPGGTSVAGKFRSVVQRLLAGVVLNPEVEVATLPTLPFVTSFVSATPEHEDSSHHSSANVAEAKVDYVVRSFVLIMTVATTVTSTVDPATIVKEKFMNPLFLVEVPLPMMSLGAEVRMRVKYNIKEKRRLKSIVDEQAELLKVREVEIENLKAQLLLKDVEATEAIRLRVEASKFEAIEKPLQDEVETLKDHNATLEKEKNDLGVKVADLAASVKVREQEVADLDTLVTSVKF